jgi:hypothetical protein
MPLLLSAAACVAVSACGGGFSTQELARAPAWFKERQKELAGQDYPDLAAVPALAKPVADQPRWDTVEKELLAEREALEASKRATGVPNAVDDPEAFDRAAREAIDAARPK